MLRADRAFGLLVLLALFSGAILIELFLTLIPHAQDLHRGGAGQAEHAVAVLVLALAVLGISLGLTSLFRQLYATLRLIHSLLARRVAGPAALARAAEGLGLEGRIDVVEDDRPFSFCYWFMRPRICLSTALVRRLDVPELRAVLLHERYHLLHRDPLRLVVARYFAAGLYVVPVVEELVRHFVLEKELEADEDAVRAMRDVRPLASALYSLLPDADDVSLGLLVPVGSLSVTEARIDQLVNGRARPVIIRPASIALSLGALAAACVLVAVQGTRVPAEHLPIVLSVPGSVVAAAALLFVAAISGGVEQVRLVARR